MKILQIHSNDYPSGGGSIAMLRLHDGFKKIGHDAKILCRIKKLKSSDSIQIGRSRRLESLLGKVTSRLGLYGINYITSFGIRKNEVYRNADIINFHGFYSYLALPSLTQNKPAVLTLHDKWNFTGHCSISYDCERWKVGCGHCPYPDNYPPVRMDNTRLEWKLKDWVYGRSSLTFIAPSRWLADEAKQSMLKRFPIHHIPHGVDMDVYRPLDPKECRSVLGIPGDKKVLMFLTRKFHLSSKGGDLMLKALQSLPKSLKADIILLLVGEGGEAIAEKVDVQQLNLGFVEGDRLKSVCYSAADLFVHPTRADNLPLVLIESMACGIPMVSFKVGGVPDLVRHGVTGYLAEPENAKDLCDGIIQFLEDKPLRNKMSRQCREIAVQEYSLNLQVQRYIDLYQEIIEKRKASMII
jgi:glycosyltransferase involved in cell wall biosynthesis